MRYFPRGIYKEQMLDREKREREGINKKYKPVDPEKISRRKEGESKQEQRMINKGETAYGQFLMDSTQDAEMEKMLDSIIDERMSQGKTDEQILAELAVMTKMTSETEAMSPEQADSRQADIVE